MVLQLRCGRSPKGPTAPGFGDLETGNSVEAHLGMETRSTIS